MTPAECRPVRDGLDAFVDGTPMSSAQQAHLDACADCQAELALAQRIERVLMAWPTAAPPPYFASSVAAAVRRETWRQEQVLDWGFNVALGAGLAAMAAGIVGVVWVVGATAQAGGAPEMAVDAASVMLSTVQTQGPVVVAATALLVTTMGAWWWAEERARW